VLKALLRVRLSILDSRLEHVAFVFLCKPLAHFASV